MPYNSITDRNDAGALIPEDAAKEIIKGATSQSAALSKFRLVNMSRNQTRVPCLAALPVAYFVNGDTGLKQTTDVAWTNRYLNAEEIAALLPIPEAVVEDMAYDIWDEAQPLLAEAIGRALDAAIFFGTNKPSSWPAAIATAAENAGNAYTYGTNDAAAGGVAADINGTMALVEADGFDPTFFVARREMRAVLRNARASDGQKLLDVATDQIEGLPVIYSMRGVWPAIDGAGAPRMFALDGTQFMLGVRKDITWKVLDQAVIQDNTGAIVYNLAQQDMVALRVVFRCAWQVANVVTPEQGNEAARYPAAVLRNATS